MVFENIDTFDYYLVRGFAVVLKCGIWFKKDLTDSIMLVQTMKETLSKQL